MEEIKEAKEEITEEKTTSGEISPEEINNIEAENVSKESIEEPPQEEDLDINAENEKENGEEAHAAPIPVEANSAGLSAYNVMSNTEERAIKDKLSVGVKMTLVMAGMTVLSIILRFLAIDSKFVPDVLVIEFSSIPEVLVSIAYGPLFGMIVVVLKSVLFSLIRIKSFSFAAVITNIVLDSVFVFITGFFYFKRMYAFNPNKPMKNKDRRRKYIIQGGLIGSAAAAIVNFFLSKFVTYPIVYWQFGSVGYSEKVILQIYQEALDNINMVLPEGLSTVITEIGSLNRALVLFSCPFMFLKYFIATLLTAFIYVYISDYLHFRKKKK